MEAGNDAHVYQFNSQLKNVKFFSHLKFEIFAMIPAVAAATKESANLQQRKPFSEIEGAARPRVFLSVTVRRKPPGVAFHASADGLLTSICLFRFISTPLDTRLAFHF